LGREFIDAGVKAVILIGGGEPLAHPMAGRLIELLGINDVHVGITTNGSFIHRYLDPIAAHSKWTRVSMDAATEEMFSILRPTKAKSAPNKFDKIVSNMRALAKVKTGKLGFSFLIQTSADGVGVSNIGEIYAAAVLARDIGCDYFEVKPTYQFREGIEHALMKHDPGLMQEAAAEIIRLDELETATFKIIYAINLKPSLEGRLDEGQPKDYKVCPSTHLRTTVTPTGVYVCPYWRGKDRMRIGDVVENTFKEVWNGDQRKEVMQRLDASQDCGFHCLRHGTNKTTIDIKQRLDVASTVQVVDEFDRFI
jgi:MoaA/NifB/PqqE/SkfB family radical SAM enzyme